MANQTMLKFGYPETMVGASKHWVVLLRPQQVTAGCLVLVCKEDATSLGAISKEAGEELPQVAASLEAALSATYGPEKFNYLALMMVDPNVHFHVIPRYSRPVNVAGTMVPDPGWPRHPDLKASVSLTGDQTERLLEDVRSNWPT